MPNDPHLRDSNGDPLPRIAIIMPMDLPRTRYLADLIKERPEAMPVFGAMAGVDIRVLKEWMGHKSIQTTMIYAAIKPMTLGHLIDKI